jgi:hypothetical protein
MTSGLRSAFYGAPPSKICAVLKDLPALERDLWWKYLKEIGVVHLAVEVHFLGHESEYCWVDSPLGGEWRELRQFQADIGRVSGNFGAGAPMTRPATSWHPQRTRHEGPGAGVLSRQPVLGALEELTVKEKLYDLLNKKLFDIATLYKIQELDRLSGMPVSSGILSLDRKSGGHTWTRWASSN